MKVEGIYFGRTQNLACIAWCVTWFLIGFTTFIILAPVDDPKGESPADLDIWARNYDCYRDVWDTEMASNNGWRCTPVIDGL